MSDGGRPFQREHPEQLEAAIVGVVLGGRMNAAQAHRALKAGELPGWNGPYDMPLATVRHYVQQARRRVETEAETKRLDMLDPGGRLRELVTKALDLGRRELARMEKADELDLDRFPKLLRAMEQAGKLAQQLTPDKPNTGPDAPAADSDDGEDETEGGDLERLLHDAQRADDPPAQDDPQGGRTPGPRPHNSTDEREEEDGSRGHARTVEPGEVAAAELAAELGASA